jgi:hypothetical protein
MTMTGQTTAQIALDHARRSRRVLIVTRRAVQASAVIQAVSEALTADDDARVWRAAGAWNVTLPNGGRIDARPYSSSYALRGLSADTVIYPEGIDGATLGIRGRLMRDLLGELRAVVATSRAPELLQHPEL